jgi:hypothetical protein
MSRHLGVAPPAREADAVGRFLDRYADTYAVILRRKLGA